MKTSQRLCLILIFIVAFGISSVYSQTRVGIKGGIDVINNSINTSMLKVDNRVGYQLGAAFELSVPILGSIESGLLFGQQNYEDKTDNGLDGAYTPISKISNYNYLTVPILFKKKLSLLGLVGIYVTGGVYGNFKVSGGKLALKEVNEIYEARKFQKGLSGGLGIRLFDHLEVGMSYRHRLGDSFSADEVSSFNKIGRNMWSVNLAYYL